MYIPPFATTGYGAVAYRSGAEQADLVAPLDQRRGEHVDDDLGSAGLRVRQILPGDEQDPHAVSRPPSRGSGHRSAACGPTSSSSTSETSSNVTSSLGPRPPRCGVPTRRAGAAPKCRRRGARRASRAGRSGGAVRTRSRIMSSGSRIGRTVVPLDSTHWTGTSVMRRLSSCASAMTSTSNANRLPSQRWNSSLPGLGAEGLEAALRVRRDDVRHRARDAVEELALHLAQAVLAPVPDPRAGDGAGPERDVCVVERGDEPGETAEIGGEVGVHEHEAFAAGDADAGLDRVALALVPGHAQQRGPGPTGEVGLDDLARPVAAAVVDDDDLVAGRGAVLTPSGGAASRRGDRPRCTQERSG